MFLFGCKDTNTENNTDTAASDTGINGITEIHLTYDKSVGEQFYLEADVVKMSEKGADIIMTKRTGPDNSLGKKKKDTVKIDKEKLDELFEILGRYDLEGYTGLQAAGTTTPPYRTLFVLNGDKVVYSVCFNTQFPKTLPPEEDIMYFELFNYFNDIIAGEEGWEEVVGENLPDPRDEPAYYERTVTWFGKEVNLVPGTGVGYDDGKYAVIDYGDKKWWIEEGFTGEWILDKDNAEDVSYASMTVNDDGEVQLTVDGVLYNGTLDEVRRLKDSVYFSLEIEGRERAATADLMIEESVESIHVSCYPLPVPETQFDPVDVYLIKAD